MSIVKTITETANIKSGQLSIGDKFKCPTYYRGCTFVFHGVVTNGVVLWVRCFGGTKNHESWRALPIHILTTCKKVKQ